MKPAAPKTERPPTTQLRKAVFRGSRNNSAAYRKLGFALFVLIAGSQLFGGTILTDTFSYSDGPLVNVSGGKWITHSGVTGQVAVVSGRVFLTQANFEDVSAYLDGHPYPTNSAAVLYAKFSVTFIQLPANNGTYFAHFKQTGTQGYHCRVGATTNNAAPGHFRLTIADAFNYVEEFPQDLSPNVTYNVMTRYVVSSATSTLWVNSVTESDPSVTVTNPAAANEINTFALRESLAGDGMGSLYLDNLVVTSTNDSRPPTILTQPVSVFRQGGENATLSVTADGQPPLHYQWHNGAGIMANATNSSLTIANAQADASYYVVASNSYGSVTSQSAQLKILVNYNTAVPTPISPTPPPPPPKPPSQHNLVVVTHGWQPIGIPQWVYDMTNSIGSNLPDSSWTVFALSWNGLGGAGTIIPGQAARRAEVIGRKFGLGISAQGWSHVHFIGHSAGAVLIQAAAEELIANSASPVEIHTTFLDPYDWSFFGGPSRFGAGSAWSDHYFESDITGPLTGGQLDNSYNVNISGLDPHTFGAHEWAYEFYQKTITGYPFDLNEGRGFPLSKEMGNWDYAINTYHRGDPPYLLGPSVEKLLASSTVPIQHHPNLVVNALSSLWNGTVYVTYNGFDLFTSLISPLKSKAPSADSFASPVWLSLGIAVTNRVNFVTFDARFTSATNAAGLLTIYWNTNEIGVLDETVTTPGLQNYSFALPVMYSSGNYVLGFRLDSFTNIVSSISITNVSFGFAGLTNPITLGISRASGSSQLTLNGPTNYNYLVQSSSNLADWIPAAIVPNTNGTTLFSDPAATNYSRRFYRAISP